MLVAVNVFITYAVIGQTTIETATVRPVPDGKPVIVRHTAFSGPEPSIITLVVGVVLVAVSIWAGWWLAGRTLRPLGRITATAQRLSLTNLDERIALKGPKDELKELADTFDAMLDRLERAVTAQSRFIANASHELRTPLAIQRAAIQIGLADPTPDRIDRFRAEMLEANRRTERLIDGLLVLAHSEHGLDDVEAVRFDRLVADVVAAFPTVKLQSQPTPVVGDPVLLTLLVTNLVDNAVRHNVPDGNVEVRVTPDGGLVVSNTGPEVPVERIPELFEPFRRMTPDRTLSADSAGLGLSIVASIARAHAMTVTARPNPGGGLTVCCRLSRLAGPSQFRGAVGR
ncbi:sensor histidine kinase [Sphaerisporangium perillae]|uniref:sensor histidine kinase n=1 Tax=Sphaerisporangium perillae TaxID=2935860 RepID=UPI00200ED767|nr:ATP-binding protein [Sphaerisporangium perillae]